MKAVFVQSGIFTADAKRLGIDDGRLQQLEKQIMEDPARSPVMTGTGGLRKIRLAIAGGGKSGGARVCYVWFADDAIVYLVAAFAKNEQSNLNKAEKNDIQKLVKGIGEFLRQRRSRHG